MRRENFVGANLTLRTD